jgi:hypothetical protein
MQVEMGVSRRTWTAAVRLALVISTVASLAAVIVSSFGEVPYAAIVLPVILVAFVSSWVQTTRLQQQELLAERLPLRTRRHAVPIG